MDVILAIDQGTQSTRVSFFDKQKECLCSSSAKLNQYCSKPGYCEQMPEVIMKQIYGLTRSCMKKALQKFPRVNVKGIGIANQRETVVAWDAVTGEPLYNSIVWRDTRTEALVNSLVEKHGGVDEYKHLTGLLFNNYITAVKIKWLMLNVEGLAEKLRNGIAIVGTIDSWIVWNLTGGGQDRGARKKYASCGGPEGTKEKKKRRKSNKNSMKIVECCTDGEIDHGCHITDVTNASRTYLMDIKSCQWSSFLLDIFDIPLKCLPKICSSSDVYGYVKNANFDDYMQNVPISGIAGDQQAACVGHGLFSVGQCKCTFGTGAFIFVNTGDEVVVPRDNTLFCTPCYQLGKNQPVKYALEGVIKTAGAGITYLKDEMKIMDHPKESVALFYNSMKKEEEEMNRRQEEEMNNNNYSYDNIVYVPKMSESFAGENETWYIRKAASDFDLNRDKAELVKALLQGIGYQLYHILENMLKCLRTTTISTIHADGGVTENDVFMKFTARLLNCFVERPADREVTSLGAAVLAGLGCGFWADVDAVEKLQATELSTVFSPDGDLIIENADKNSYNDFNKLSLYSRRYERADSSLSTSTVSSVGSGVASNTATLERLSTWKQIVFSQSSSEEWISLEEYVEQKRQKLVMSNGIGLKEADDANFFFVPFLKMLTTA